jgi:hypothetical protein
MQLDALGGSSQAGYSGRPTVVGYRNGRREGELASIHPFCQSAATGALRQL